MKEVAAQRQQEEEAFYRQQELMIDAENQRRAMISQEEEKLVDQRSRFVRKNEWLETSAYLSRECLLSLPNAAGNHAVVLIGLVLLMIGRQISARFVSQ